ncbi:hypothetical protein Tco_1017766 [Tanacetum coccineum]|uniref:Uncharacterized protein n=1 Tax=Tanacetum coccineum TaxID=301880 RepID=A0ABQ5FSH9_9ASTR
MTNLSTSPFAYVLWIFLAISRRFSLSLHILSSPGNEDTNFDLAFQFDHSFMPECISHAEWNFMKFNDFPDCEDSRARSIHKSFTSSASFWESSRKAYLLEDKQIPNVGVFDEVFSTWMAIGGNTRDLGSFGEEMDKTTTLHQVS